MNEFYEKSDAEGEVLRFFISEWFQMHGHLSCGVSELYRLIMQKNIPLELGEKSERSQKIILGKTLSRIRDRRFRIGIETSPGRIKHTTFQVTAGKTVKRIQQWKLVACEEPVQAMPAEPEITCRTCGYTDEPGEQCCYYGYKGTPGPLLPVAAAFNNCPLKAEENLL